MTFPPYAKSSRVTGSRASKALGQNFLLDEQLLARIAAIPGDLTGKAVLEVGPGPGGLTRALLRAGARVTAIEMDRRCLPALDELGEAFPGQLRIIQGDALKLDHDELMAGEPFAVLSNLPYNVGTALFVRWLGGESLAAALDQPDADVPAGSGAADRRRSRHLGLWSPRGSGAVALVPRDWR